MKKNQLGKLLQSVQKNFPFIAMMLVISLYIGSAVVHSYFLYIATNVLFVSGLLGFLIQATRGALVFFDVLNPSKPPLGNAGYLFAVFMGLASVGEIYYIGSYLGTEKAAVYSTMFLMICGVILECLLLREFKFSMLQEIDLLSYFSVKDKVLATKRKIAEHESNLDLIDGAITSSKRQIGYGKKTTTVSDQLEIDLDSSSIQNTIEKK